jgi:hypothetical protein
MAIPPPADLQSGPLVCCKSPQRPMSIASGAVRVTIEGGEAATADSIGRHHRLQAIGYYSTTLPAKFVSYEFGKIPFIFAEGARPRSMTLGRFVNSAWVSDKHRYIYVSNEKVASSTTKQFLMRLEEPAYYRMSSVKRYHGPLKTPSQVGLRRWPSVVRDYTKFSIVRDPYTRVLSGYLHKIARVRSVLPEHRIHATFAEFLTDLSKQAPSEMNVHFRPQHLTIATDFYDFDHIGRLEHFDAFQAYIANLCGGSSASGQDARHPTDAALKIEQYYTAQELDLANRIYAKDFEIFGYEMRG